MNDLTGRVALITGAGGGFGLSIAKKLGASGADLVLNYRTSGKPCQELVETHRRRGGRAIAVQADITDRASVSDMVSTSISELGSLDILVNNAGVLNLSSFQSSQEAARRQEIEVNVFGVMNVTEAALPHLIRSAHGRIINLSSHIVLGGWDRAPVYAGTKGFILTWTKSLAAEIGTHGTTVNAIAPGGILTDMSQGVFGDDVEKQQRAEKSALGRLGDVEDVANVALFLASDSGSYITGQMIAPNGGARM